MNRIAFAVLPLLLLAMAGRAEEREEVVVRADAGWTDTGLDVEAGAPLMIRSTGKWSNVGDGQLTDPDGWGPYDGTEVEEANIAELIGRVGDEMFRAGRFREIRPQSGGRLWLAMNDLPGSSVDNQGTVTSIVLYVPQRSQGNDVVSPDPISSDPISSEPVPLYPLAIGPVTIDPIDVALVRIAPVHFDLVVYPPVPDPRGYWWWIAGAIAVLLLGTLATMMARHRKLVRTMRKLRITPRLDLDGDLRMDPEIAQSAPPVQIRASVEVGEARPPHPLATASLEQAHG